MNIPIAWLTLKSINMSLEVFEKLWPFHSLSINHRQIRTQIAPFFKNLSLPPSCKYQETHIQKLVFCFPRNLFRVWHRKSISWLFLNKCKLFKNFQGKSTTGLFWDLILGLLIRKFRRQNALLVKSAPMSTLLHGNKSISGFGGILEFSKI